MPQWEAIVALVAAGVSIYNAVSTRKELHAQSQRVRAEAQKLGVDATGTLADTAIKMLQQARAGFDEELQRAQRRILLLEEEHRTVLSEVTGLRQEIEKYRVGVLLLTQQLRMLGVEPWFDVEGELGIDNAQRPAPQPGDSKGMGRDSKEGATGGG